VDMAQAEAFLAVAEELHFGRAADRLHVSQPRVSRLIAALEREIGGKLFNRTSRRVALTPLGQQFHTQLTSGYAQMQAALAEARTAARGVTGVLRIGCTITTGGPAVTRLVDEFSTRYPGCEVTLHQLGTFEPYADLRRGEVDLVVSWLAADEPDLTAGPVIEYRDRVLAVGHTHRLAGRKSVSAEELADEQTHETPPGYPPALVDALIPRCTPSGRPIRRIPASSFNSEDLIMQVVRGRIVHPTMAGIPLFRRPDMVLVPIRDLPPMPLGLIWCTARENARIRALAATAQSIHPQPGHRTRRHPTLQPK
jgi:DNA-binding transcriptional LysR family regulator